MIVGIMVQRGWSAESVASSAGAALPTLDARDRLVSHQQRAGVTTTYMLDQPAGAVSVDVHAAGVEVAHVVVRHHLPDRQPLRRGLSCTERTRLWIKTESNWTNRSSRAENGPEQLREP
jgi:hypothetical protein